MTIYDLIWFGLAGLALFGLWQHMNVSRQARHIAAQHCQARQVLLLDQSVLLAKVSICRSKSSLFAIQRHYTFEFSTVGDVRYPGEIAFEGKRLTRIELQPHKV